MPIGRYATFGECVSAQRRKGKSKISAQKICGFIEKQTKKGHKIKKLTKKKK